MTRKIISALITIMLYSSTVNAQKTVIDTVAINHWAHINEAKLSPGGNYVYYTITDSLNQPHGFIQSTNSKWKEEISGDCQFTGDDKQLVQLANDSLFVGPIGSKKRKFIARTQSFKLVKNKKKELLLYRSGNQRTLVLGIYDLSSGKEWKVENLKDYFFKSDIPEVNNLLVAQISPDTAIKTVSLSLLDLVTGGTKKIWEGNFYGGVVFDGQGKQIAYISEEGTGSSRYAIWVHNTETGISKKIVDSHIEGLPNLVVDDHTNIVFNKDGSGLLFAKTIIQKQATTSLNQKMNIWNYKDVFLPANRKNKYPRRSFVGLVHIETGKIFQFDNENYRLLGEFNSSKKYIVAQQTTGTGMQLEKGFGYLSRKEKLGFYLFSLADGTMQFIREMTLDNSNTSVVLSPDENYVFIKDPNTRKFYSLELATKKQLEFEIPDCPNIYMAGWLDDIHVLIYDRWTDIWKVDLSGKMPPQNLTRGYAKANMMEFHMLRSESGDYKDRRIKISQGKAHLTAFDKETKKEGLYFFDLTGQSNPESLYIGDYHYSEEPEKAQYSETWLVERQRADQAPNFFVTKGFKKFTPITDVQPQRKYNWLTSELIKWKVNDTTELQGILYKPENFDPTKKYPIIFHYYEAKSDEVNHFHEPNVSSSSINIPWYVSRGYLICEPDIGYMINRPGRSALEAITSAASYLKQFPWVDVVKMGLQGNSFGGFETNYIVTHSNLFAAAVEHAGATDLISAYCGISEGLAGRNTYFYEEGQGRMESSLPLWQNKQNYIDESPIFNADNITTPLLMVHNKKDDNVDWQQGVELFTALWRMGKPCWMLQYDDSSHGQVGDDALDYTIRMTQFFDHYLKGAPMPKWMSAKDDERYTGYELNTNENQ